MESADIDLLLHVARAGSLSGAAKRLGVAVSTVGRRLDALEATLGLRLIDRRMNGARLTPSGERIVALAEPVAEGLARINRTAATMRQSGNRKASLFLPPNSSSRMFSPRPCRGYTSCDPPSASLSDRKQPL